MSNDPGFLVAPMQSLYLQVAAQNLIMKRLRGYEIKVFCMVYIFKGFHLLYILLMI